MRLSAALVWRRAHRWSAMALVALLCVAPAAVAAGDAAAPRGAQDAQASSGAVRFPGEIPLRRDEPRSDGAGSPALRIGVLVMLLGIAGAVLIRKRGGGPAALGGWWSKARWVGGGSPSLTVLHSLRLPSGGSLHVVRWGSRELLIGACGQGLTLVSEGGAVAPDCLQGTAVKPGSST